MSKRTNLKKTSKIKIKKYIANSTVCGFDDGVKHTDFVHLVHDGQIPKEENCICMYANDVKVVKGNTEQALQRLKYSYRSFNKTRMNLFQK